MFLIYLKQLGRACRVFHKTSYVFFNFPRSQQQWRPVRGFRGESIALAKDTSLVVRPLNIDQLNDSAILWNSNQSKWLATTENGKSFFLQCSESEIFLLV